MFTLTGFSSVSDFHPASVPSPTAAPPTVTLSTHTPSKSTPRVFESVMYPNEIHTVWPAYGVRSTRAASRYHGTAAAERKSYALDVAPPLAEAPRPHPRPRVRVQPRDADDADGRRGYARLLQRGCGG